MRCAALGGNASAARSSSASRDGGGIGGAERRAAEAQGRPSCEDCFFHRHDALRPRPRRALPHLPARHSPRAWCRRASPRCCCARAARASRWPRCRRVRTARGRSHGEPGCGRDGGVRLVTMRITVLGKSPSWQDAGGACSGYLVEDGDDLAPARLRQRRLLEAARCTATTSTSTRSLDLPPARRPLPRPRPLLLRAHLRAHASSRSRSHTWPGTDDPARPRLIAPPGRARDLPPGRRRLGQRGPDRERLRARGVRRRATRSRSGRSRRQLPARSRTSSRPSRSTSAPPTAAGGSPTAPTAARARRSSRSPGTPTCCSSRRPCRAPSAPAMRGHMTPAEAGEHARRAGAKRVVITHISDELDDDWAREEGREALRRRRSRWRARAPSTRSERRRLTRWLR